MNALRYLLNIEYIYNNAARFTNPFVSGVFYGSPVPLEIVEGFLKRVLQLEESLGWKREVLNVILEVALGGLNTAAGWERVAEETRYTGTAVRSTSRMVGERDKSVNINITRFNTSPGAGAARLPTCCAVPVRHTPNEDNLSENLMTRDCVKISKYLPRFSSFSHICLFLGASTNTDFSLGLILGILRYEDTGLLHLKKTIPGTFFAKNPNLRKGSRAIKTVATSGLPGLRELKLGTAGRLQSDLERGRVHLKILPCELVTLKQAAQFTEAFVACHEHLERSRVFRSRADMPRSPALLVWSSPQSKNPIDPFQVRKNGEFYPMLAQCELVDAQAGRHLRVDRASIGVLIGPAILG
ncbi:hypothetical protein C8F04DRAFT_1227889 [Mycena alexandri]|uniref:Uncharacterized protein n=1 Tax=Mycena alexandri TaxID=1745969 RepID=A0AAD6TKB9_9AGAR|nr:hypothetical protein C8F04DRAFT_1227889 [Mycena alexandri]